jgi:hypothetical protein
VYPSVAQLVESTLTFRYSSIARTSNVCHPSPRGPSVADVDEDQVLQPAPSRLVEYRRFAGAVHPLLSEPIHLKNGVGSLSGSGGVTTKTVVGGSTSLTVTVNVQAELFVSASVAVHVTVAPQTPGSLFTEMFDGHVISGGVVSGFVY